MSRQRPLGLIAAGSPATSPLARLPEFRKKLGPVKSVSLRVASRMVNTMGAGFPIDQWNLLNGCEAVFVIVPDSQAGIVVADMAAASLDWRHKSVILADTWLGSGILESLAGLGAETGSVCQIDSSAHARFLIEGTRTAVVEVKRCLRPGDRSFTLGPEAKPLVLAALSFSESLIFPLLQAASECLRLAGIPPLQAGALLEARVSGAARAHGKSGRKAWWGPLPAADAHLMRRQMEALEQNNPELARFFFDQCARALAYFGRDSEWFLNLAARPAEPIGCEDEGAH